MLFAACTQKPQETIETVVTVSPTAIPTPTAQERFDDYTERVFRNEIALNTINLHYTLAYPENYGITEYEPTLGSFALENMIQSY